MTAADITPFLKKHPTGAVCVLVSLVCGALLYLRSDVAAASQAEYEARAAEALQMSNNVKGAPGLAEQVTEIQNLATDMESRLVQMGQLAVNLQYFYKLEADHAVKLLDVRQNTPVRPARGAPKTLYTRVPFSLTVKGTYTELIKLLGKLQNGRHLCRINSAAFSRIGSIQNKSSPDEDVNLTLSLELLGQQ